MTIRANPTVVTRLRNGLEVRLKPIRTTPIISSWIWYRVGSRNEVPGGTGLSHFVEHIEQILKYFSSATKCLRMVARTFIHHILKIFYK